MPPPLSPNGQDPRHAPNPFLPLEVPPSAKAGVPGADLSEAYRIWEGALKRDLSVSQLSTEFCRRVHQQALVEHISSLSVAVGDANYDPKSCETLIHATVEALRDGLGADSAYMLELLAVDVAFCVRAYAGRAIDANAQAEERAPDANKHLSASAETAAGWALRSNRVICVKDYPRQERFERECWPAQEQVRSAINMRVQAQKKPFGVLVAQSNRAERFGQTDALFVRTLANFLSQALACARAQHHQERMYHEFRRTMVAREEALSVISHDLRSPATTVKLSLEVVRRSLVSAGTSAEPIERAISKAQAGIDRMMAMMDELLEMNRAEADAFHLTRAPVDLREVIDEVVGEMDSLVEASGSVICVEGPESLVGQWDRTRLHQVIANLVSNALKYGDGGPVWVKFGCCDSTAYFLVRDEGVGIAAEDQKRVFERFVRVDPTPDRASMRGRKKSLNSGSYGLGLWIVRRVVEAFGGTLHLRSRPGVGSTFRVELPLGNDG